MRELAAIDAIPSDLIPEEYILEKLPVFFWTVRGQKPTEEDLKNLF